MSPARRKNRPTFRATVVPDGREAGSLILRDGQKMKLSRALAEDGNMVCAFLERLSELERDEVLGSLRITEQALGTLFESLAEKSQGAAFVVQDENDEKVRALGAFKLLAGLKDTASLTLAVEGDLRHMGVGTIVFEQLSLLAARLGVTRLVGISQADNRPLTALFKASGLETDVRLGDGTTTFLISTRGVVEALESSGSPAGPGSSVASSLKPLFNPRSIAIVGASRSPGSLGHRVLTNLVENGFSGPVYPVNPKADHIRSISCFPSLQSIGHDIDLAIVMVPAVSVIDVVKEAAAVGVKALVIISAGFSESGGVGPQRERDLAGQVRRLGLRMIGPNSMGIIRSGGGGTMNASLSPIMPLPGSVALCSHSGALGIAITALSRRLGLGLSTFVSIGNRTDLSGNDLLEYWEEDEATNVILYYLESFGNPRHFARIARRVGRSKPIIAVKAGRSAAGRRSGGVHDSLMNVNIAIECLMNQTGLISADSLEEMFDIARALTDQPLPQGRRVAIVTNAGGPAMLCVDALAAAGLLVNPLHEETQKCLHEILQPEATTRNPVDILAASGPEEYRRVIECVLQADEVDALVVIYTPVGLHTTAEVSEAVAQAVTSIRNTGIAKSKPVLASIVGEEVFRTSLEGGHGARIPVYSFPEATGAVLAKISTYAKWRMSDPGVFPEFRDQRLHQARQRCRKVLKARGPSWLPAEDVAVVLKAAAIPTLPSQIVHDAEAAAAAAADLGFPVVMKAVTGLLDGRSEVGGVKLDVIDADAARAAFEAISDAYADPAQSTLDGVLVQAMTSGCAEVKISVCDDPRFGPLISFSLAGGLLEVLDDASYGVSPLTDVDAQAMVQRVPGAKLLDGYRGHPAVDVDAAAEALLRLSRLVEAVQTIKAVELSPLFIAAPGGGFTVSEARIMVGPVDTKFAVEQSNL